MQHVGAEQVQSLFDDADVEQVAQQTQAPKQDIYNAISAVLPQIIDSLTPQGEQTSKQEANDDIQQVMNLVSGFLKVKFKKKQKGISPFICRIHFNLKIRSYIPYLNQILFCYLLQDLHQ